MLGEFGKFMIEGVKEGHIAIYGMIALALFGIAVTAERVKALYFTYSIKLEAFSSQVRTLIIANKMEEAIALCANQGTALLPKVIKAILERSDRDDESIRAAYDIASMEIVPMITRRLGFLAMIANVATLIGLLGTINGLIQSFQAVSFAAPDQKQTLLAQGISISMNTTALGLIVAIPIMVVFAFLQARQNKLLEEIISTATKVVDMLISRNYRTFEEMQSDEEENVRSMPKRKAA